MKHSIWLIRVFVLTALCLSHSLFAQYRPGLNNNISLLGHLHQYQRYSNIWGYTDAQGREYALLTTQNGLSIVDITNPQNPVQVKFVPGPVGGGTIWRELKTYSHYAYVVSEHGTPSEYAGLQIVDLARLPDSVSYSSWLWPGVTANTAQAHTISVDEQGYLYVQGGSATIDQPGDQGGVRIISLADPAAPQAVGAYSTRYVHDSYAHKNILFNSNIYQGGFIDVLDISDRSRPRLLTSIIYPNGFSHNSGVSEDGNYLLTTDETPGQSLKIWDIGVLWDNDPSNDRNIGLVAEYPVPVTSIAHNVHVRGRHAFVSHYDEGVKVLDISNPRDPAEIGYYDTSSEPPGFNGAWGVFPYFPSGTFVVSDIETGLYVFRLDSTGVASVQGNVTNSAGGAALTNATIHFLEANKTLRAGANGEYRLRTSSGRHTIVFKAFPFATDTVRVNVANGDILQLDNSLTPLLELSALRGELREANGKGIRAKLTLYVSSDQTADYVLTDSSDSQGNFAFDNIFVSSPPLVAYDRLVIEPEIPYLTRTLPNLVVAPGAPTVLQVTVEQADVLVVNDDPLGNFQNHYTTALQAAQITAYYWPQAQRGPAPVSAMNRFNRNVMIWFTGNASGSEVLTPAERDSLAAYLDRGGRLFLTGQNIAESLQGSEFLQQRLHVSFEENLNDFFLHGVQSDPIGKDLLSVVTAGGGGANNQTSRDVLLPDAHAAVCMVYDTTSGMVAGVHVEDATNQSRLVLFGFGFESIIRQPARYATPEQVLQNVMNWLTGATGVAESATELPGTFSLSASYPNPWRMNAGISETIIRFQLPIDLTAERVTLKIFDLLGREVTTLLDQAYQSGQFAARWNGRDRAGEMVKSGVYFYKLQAGAQQQAGKLLIVR